MSSAWQPYNGETYLSYEDICAWMKTAVSEFPDWVNLTSIGSSRNGLPLYLMTIGQQDTEIDKRTGFWLDGGTHGRVDRRNVLCFQYVEMA